MEVMKYDDDRYREELKVLLLEFCRRAASDKASADEIAALPEVAKVLHELTHFA